MLRQDIVDAVAAGRFHVHTVTAIDDAIELLTGISAGAPDASGAFPPGSLNARVDARLAALAERQRQFGRGVAEKPGAPPPA
jgi:hypothetical protein